MRQPRVETGVPPVHCLGATPAGETETLRVSSPAATRHLEDHNV